MSVSGAVFVSVNHRQLGLDRVTAGVMVGNKRGRTRNCMPRTSFELELDPPMAVMPERLSDMKRASGALWSNDALTTKGE
jgi:hypothetical protein